MMLTEFQGQQQKVWASCSEWDCRLTWHKLLVPRRGKKDAEEHGHFCGAEGSAQPLINLKR